MRTYSTPQSAHNGEITKLGIIECIASVSLYVYIGVYFGTFKYLAVAIVFAPLMLFRTETSAEWGIKVYGQGIDAVIRRFRGTSNQGVVRIVLIILVIASLGTAIRVFATLYWTIRKPLKTFKEAPRNWLRQSFCTDFLHPPEIIPLEIIKGSDSAVPAFPWAVHTFKQSKSVAELIGMIIAAAPLIAIGWLPSMLYRISFKATALAYVPFIWVAHATLRNPLPLKARLERFTKGELEKVRRGVSYFVLGTLAAKGALVLNWVDRSYVESKFPSQKIVTDFVVLDAWPWWQITFAADALLTVGLLLFADAALSRIEGGQPWREESVMTTVTSVSFLRAAFGLVTISHFFYIALLAAAPNSVRPLLAF